MALRDLSLFCVLAPLAGAAIAGIAGKWIGRRASHSITILGMSISFLAALVIFYRLIVGGHEPFYGTIYTWAVSGNFHFNVGFLVDKLSALMMVTVTFVSLLVHIYSIGYMHDDPGYQRFFAYMSLFTFFMLILVVANNFALLFFGWEGVGLVSYLLIGFWFNKESAAQGSLKAFIVNRVGDFGFILGLAAILDYAGSLDYATVFAGAPDLVTTTIQILPHVDWSIITVICILLFIGAMGKSAQLPLHIWLPESMEGPTPISALIHAATMVTAGVYMVARMSPIFDLSMVASSTVLIVGATGALLLGILGLVQNDIKRIIAYSTMSQLGYMMAANGALAFSSGIFHLVTHACFKALLFLAAGSVIMALHHEQDIRKMGNLRKYMPITYVTFLIGALALAAIPPFSGFYSKDSIIEAVHESLVPGAYYAYVCLLIATFVTALYTFRCFFLVFHTKERMPEAERAHIHESSTTIILPLILLAIPSFILGVILVGPMLYKLPPLLGSTVVIDNVKNQFYEHIGTYHGPFREAISAVLHLPFWFALAGIFTAWLCYIKYPHFPAQLSHRFRLIYKVLINKYGFDAFTNLFFVKGSRALSGFFYKVADEKLLDGYIVDGSGEGINRISLWVKRLQSGYLYHYALVMIVGLVGFLVWLIV